jgi:hypothetical protein
MPAVPAAGARNDLGEAAIIPLETCLPIPLEGVKGRRTGEGDLAIHPGESVRVRALIRENARNVAWRLRLSGEVDVDRGLRTEEGFPPFYRLIDDALDPRTTHHRSYSLVLLSNGELYPRRAYFRVFCNPTADEREYLFKVWMRTEGLETFPGGRVGVEAAVYQKRPGRNRGDITGPPDKVYFLDGGEGTQDWQERQLPVRLEGDVACVLFTIVGERFRGRFWLEDPQFPQPNSPNGLPPFAPSRPNRPYLNWLGENLSEKEWPKFRLTLNEKEFFHGKLFQPVYSWPSAEVDVPAGLPHDGENDLTIELVSDYYQALAYNLRKLEWLQVPNGAMEVVACPKLVEAGNEFPVTIRTRDPGLQTRVHVAPAPDQQRTGIAPVQSDLVFPTAGLHFVRFRAERGGPGGTIKFRFGEKARQVNVERVVERENDGVLVGSGDSFYVAAEPQSLERFYAWFLHHSLGNSIVYRVIYQWGGTQALNPEAWKETIRFCEAAGLKYSLILDGREMPGTDGNPTDEMLAGPFFLGSQLHERDGMYNYGGPGWRWPDEEFFQAVYERLPAHGRGGTIGDPRLWGGRAMEPLFFDPHRARDMREGAEYFVENIRRALPLARRHSGPSTLFKYFFQAGYKWLAAETMYGPHEIILGALRGASLAYGQPRYGAHIAAEWSTTPHDDPAAFRRYFLALATPYIHGTEHIYIEDGLWHMEEGFSADDRFSPACQGHLKVHQDFVRFTRTHSRRGHMRVPVGFLQGQHDGWNCWTHATVWGQAGSQWEFAEPEKSWDLLKVFFPRSVLASIYREPCPHEPVGFFSGTPYGPADIVPVEAGLDTFSKYSALVFLGWNTANTEQVERLREYVKAGGHLILALPHLSTETRRKQLPRLLAGPQVQQLLGLKFLGFKTSSGKYLTVQFRDQCLATGLCGRMLQLGDVILDGAVARLTDEAGTPVLVERKFGTGQVTFVNVATYPGDAALEGLYRELLSKTGERVVTEQRARVWGRGSENASFTVYDWDQIPGRPSISTVYFLNVNWWSDDSQPCEAHLLWEDADIPLAITRGKIHAVTVAGDWGIWTCDTDTDVRGLHPDSQGVEVSLQGQGKTRLQLLYRPAARSGSTVKLCGKSSQDPLTIEALDVPGLWQTEVMLQGPEVLQISLCE